ncbi:MAG: hypothetical protein JKY01_12380 [Pseudomonadales bacterium]|nr:hypothetical protein [Pseudomonadales bacterium]
MEIVDNLANSQFVLSLLGLFLVNIMILMVILLLRQKSTMEKELLGLQDQIAALADSTYGVKKRVVEAEKRISMRINQLKTEAILSRTPPKEAVSIDSMHTPFSLQGVDMPAKQHSGKPSRASSKAEEDILAAIGGL